MLICAPIGREAPSVGSPRTWGSSQPSAQNRKGSDANHHRSPRCEGHGHAEGCGPSDAQGGPVTLPVCSGCATSEGGSRSVAEAFNPLER